MERTWPGYLALHEGDQSLAYNCLQSLSQACTGQVTQQPELIELAHRSYTSCLRRVHAQLDDPQQRCNDDVLLPIMLFGSFEMLFLTESEAWIRHVLGLAALFELRGPEAFAPCGIAIQVFRNNRRAMIMAALKCNRATFLSREEWVTRPWIVSEMPKDTFELLLDIVVQLPGLNVRSLEICEGDSRLGIHRDALTVLSQLFEWRKHFEASPYGERTTLSLPPSLEASYPRGHLQPPIDYLNSYAAMCDSQYQGAIVFVARIALATVPPDMNNASGLSFAIEHAALETCRSLSYFIVSPYSQKSKLDALWSLAMAWKVLAESASAVELKEWLKSQTEAFAATFGSWMVSPKELGTAIRDR